MRSPDNQFPFHYHSWWGIRKRNEEEEGGISYHMCYNLDAISSCTIKVIILTWLLLKVPGFWVQQTLLEQLFFRNLTEEQPVYLFSHAVCLFFTSWRLLTWRSTSRKCWVCISGSFIQLWLQTLNYTHASLHIYFITWCVYVGLYSSMKYL